MSDDSPIEAVRKKSVDDSAVQKLIELARTDRNAIAQLYQLHHELVAAYVVRRVAHNEDAKDIISEVFIAMVNGLPYFRWRGIPFRIWLYRIATNKIGRWARRRRAIVLAPLEDIAEKVNGGSNLDTELIPLALESLPLKLQHVLTLHYLEGLSIAEVAAILNRSEGTVKSRLHTGRAALRQQLERRGINLE